MYTLIIIVKRYFPFYFILVGGAIVFLPESRATTEYEQKLN